MKLPINSLKKGDLVTFLVPEKSNTNSYIPLICKFMLKEVGALEDDTVEIVDNSLYINQKLYGKIYKKNEGIDLPQLSERDLQPKKGEFLPLAPAHNSWDGRYWGTIKLEEIKNKMKLLISFEGIL